MQDNAPSPSIGRWTAYQAAVDAVIDAAIRRHDAQESTLEYRVYEQAENACLEALCSIVDAYCAGRIAELFTSLRRA